MSKRIIVDDCIDCPYGDCVPVRDYFVRKCRASVGCIIEGKIPPDWCPLPEMPEREDTISTYKLRQFAKEKGISGAQANGWKQGWNACLDEIEGGEEDE